MVCRDLTAAAWSAGYAAPSELTPAQSAAFAARVQLIEEPERADAVLIGAPMYNFSIPSTLRAWLTACFCSAVPRARPTPPRAPRSSSQAAAAPTRRAPRARASSSYRTTFVQNYLGAVLKGTLGLDLDFIVPELTMAPSPRNPAMSERGPLYRASRERAFEEATTKAKELAERLAA